MALPPERISLKRRRAEETVDTLVFDPNKRRHTGIRYLRQDNDVVPATSRSPSQALPANTAPPLRAGYDANGIPTVRASAPADEVKALAKLRAATQNARTVNDDTSSVDAARIQGQSQSAPTGTGPSSAPLSDAGVVLQQSARRFHLTADLTDNLHKNQHAHRVQTSATRFKSLRPTIATFVERHSHPSTVPDPGPQSDKEVNAHLVPQTSLPDQGFQEQKQGQSMHDPVSTWDIESDQLADELAAFALELDPGTNHYPEDTTNEPVQQTSSDASMLLDDDYVYETYVRVPYHDTQLDSMMIDSNANIGFLIIDQDVEDLWEEYLNEGEDEDDEWDEEDSNAEDNPANEYPEDEVDSDDEFGHNAYRYRNNGSDDEHYDQDYDD